MLLISNCDGVKYSIMDAQDLDPLIAAIPTRWSRLLAPDHEIMRYYGAVYRYLLGMTGQRTVAEELANEFAVRFLAGKFKNADPKKGRLRDLIKAAVRNLALDYWRAQKKAKKAISLDESKVADQLLAGRDDHQAFESACRDDCLARAWQALEQAEKTDGKPFFTVLKFKVDHPEMRSEELAKQIGALLKKPISTDTVRQTVHRARSLFAALLLDLVSQSIGSPDIALLEEELIELKLLDYCKSALDRRKKN